MVQRLDPNWAVHSITEALVCGGGKWGGTLRSVRGRGFVLGLDRCVCVFDVTWFT